MSSEQNEGPRRGVILVVDDDPAMRVLLRKCLADWQVEEAADGEAGLAKARQLLPDLVIVDWVMPRMDGADMVRELRADAQLSHTPVVLLTARSDVGHRAEGYHSGADHFLPKPFETEELLAIVDRAVERTEPLSYAAPLMHALQDRVDLEDIAQIGEAVSLLADFQQRMLPPCEARLGNLTAGASLVPSVMASGDFYDYIPCEDGRSLGFVVGDVSGRGLAAAYFMVMVRTAVRILARERCALADTVAALNETLLAETPTGWFVTLFCGLVDPATSGLRYISAGHCPAVLCRPQEPPILLETTGPALGLFPGQAYPEASFALRPGDHLVCATDGVIDAVRTDDLDERYDWIADVVRRHQSQTPAEIAGALVEGARADAQGGHKDDLTALVLRSAR